MRMKISLLPRFLVLFPIATTIINILCFLRKKFKAAHQTIRILVLRTDSSITEGYIHQCTPLKHSI